MNMSLQDLHNEYFGEEQYSEEELEKIAEAEAYEAYEAEKTAAEAVAAGRFMARGYADELEKLASESKVIQALSKALDSTKELSRKGWNKYVGVHNKAVGAIKSYHKKGFRDLKTGLTGKANKGAIKAKPLTRLKRGAQGAARFLPHAVVTGYGGKKVYDAFQD